MEERELRDLETIFAQVEDPRLERTKLHRLHDIIIIAICGVICGADGWWYYRTFSEAWKWKINSSVVHRPPDSDTGESSDDARGCKNTRCTQR